MKTELKTISNYIKQLEHSKKDYEALLTQPEKIHLLVNAKIKTESSNKFKKQLMAIGDELENTKYDKESFKKGKDDLIKCIDDIIKEI